MRILLAGEWRAEIHEAALAEGFRKLGHEVAEFSWWRLLGQSAQFGYREVACGLARRVQAKILLGPAVRAANRTLLDLAARVRPNLVFVYRGACVRPATIRSLRALPGAPCVAGYCNDDPFSPAQPKWVWRYLLSSIPHYDIVFAYRPHNLLEMTAVGARRAHLLPPWYLPQRNRPIDLTAPERMSYGCEVVFVGHYERDGRLELLERLAAAGVSLRLFGPEWNGPASRSRDLRKFVPVPVPRGDDYNRAINGAKIALCFLSHLNRDAYTRRCFEIPAAGVMMLSERSKELEGMFRPGIEADYFDGAEELIAKVRLYLSNDNLRRRVAAAGRLRLGELGADPVARAATVVQIVESTTHARAEATG